MLGAIPGSGREGSALTTHRLRAALESPGSVPGIREPPAPSPRSSRGQGQLSKQRDTCAGKARATRDILGSRGGSLNLPFSFDLHPSSLCSSASPHVCFPLFFPEVVLISVPPWNYCWELSKASERVSFLQTLSIPQRVSFSPPPRGPN